MPAPDYHELNYPVVITVSLIMKRAFVVLMMLFYAASAFAAVPWQPARAMHDGSVAAMTGEQHDCDEGGEIGRAHV